MADPRQQHPHGPSRHGTSAHGFVAPRLELPRFRFAPSQPPVVTQQRRQHQPAAPAAPPRAWTHAPAPAPSPYVAGAVAHAPLQHELPPAPVMAPAPPSPADPRPIPSPLVSSPTASARPANVAWSVAEPPAERSLLQRVRPVHMGALLIVAVAIMTMSAGPSSMRTSPVKLPAAVDGGGGSDIGVPAMSSPVGSTPPVAAPPSSAPAKAAAARELRIGTASVPANVHSGGIPSPAAAAQLAVAGGGRYAAGRTDTATMAGMPSPAAAAKLGPEQLPFRPSDGVTLPRTGLERDSHAVDAHYGADSLPMEEPAAPVVTPAQAAAVAERQSTLSQLRTSPSPADGLPPAPAQGYASAL